MAGGFYKPSVSYLRPIRERIATDPASFEQLLEETERRDLQVTSMGDTLTGMPKVFSDDREEDVAEYLRWKNLVTRRAVLDSAVVSPEFAERAIDVTGACRPLLEYVWDAEQETASGRS